MTAINAMKGGNWLLEDSKTEETRAVCKDGAKLAKKSWSEPDRVKDEEYCRKTETFLFLLCCRKNTVKRL